MAKVYGVVNGAGATTAASVAVTSSTAIKTMIQMLASANREIRVVEWWWEGNASAAATPAQVELMFHSTGAATVTAYVLATDVKKYEPNAVNSQITLTTTGSGYSASAEGAPATALGGFDHFVPPTSGIYIQYPLGREPEAAVSTFIRLRNTVTPAVNVLCGISWEE